MIGVLRIGHRVGRDKRMTTHCALTARALGAERIVYTGDQDKKMEKNVEGVSDEWGGDFKIVYEESWKKYLKNFDGKKVYLAMFGVPYEEEIEDLRHHSDNMIVVIGGEKVPGEIYNYIDIQIAVTNQPHSEVAALAVFLDRLNENDKREFRNANIKVTPKKKSKEIEEI